MSGILDRLNGLEEASSSPPSGLAGSGRRVSEPKDLMDAPSTNRLLDNDIPTSTSRKLGVGQVAVALLVISVALFAWRLWKAHISDRSATERQVASRVVATGSAVNTNVVLPGAQKDGASGAQPAKAHSTDAGDTAPGVALAKENWSNALTPADTADTAPAIAGSLAMSPVSRMETRLSQGNHGSAAMESPSSQQAGPEPAIAVHPGAGVLTPQEDQKTKDFLLQLRISGLYKDTGGYVALIDGRPCQEGYRLGEVEIVRITSQRLTFAYKGKRYHMPIRR